MFLLNLFSNDSKPQINKEESCFKLNFGGEIIIKQEVFIKILPWLLAAIAGGTYIASNEMSPSNAKLDQGELGVCVASEQITTLSCPVLWTK